MIKGQIIIKLSDGSIVTYANRFLANKEGDDGLTPIPNKKFPGFAGISYYYTGQGNDTYEDQKSPGMIKADYEYLISQMDTVTESGILIFPENDKVAVAAPVVAPNEEKPNPAAGTKVLVRKMMSTANTGLTFSRTKIFLNEIVSINIIEDWVDFPYGRESGYQLPKTSPNFYGFAEGKERNAKGVDKGPDFDKYWTTDNGYIPRPILELDNKNKLIVKNEEEFTKIVSKQFDRGYEVYGVREYKDEFGKVEKFKNSGTVVIYNKPIYCAIKRNTNNEEVNIPNSTIKVLEGQTINYGTLTDNDGKYSFVKWTKDKNGSEEVPTVAPKEDFEVFAQWEEIKYTVTKNLNYEGAADPETISVAVGGNITYGTPAERTGYDFVKWTTDPEGKADAPQVMGTENITVYAQWKEIPKQPEPDPTPAPTDPVETPTEEPVVKTVKSNKKTAPKTK